MTYGWISGEQGTSNKNLQWMVGQRSLWKTEWKPDVWHNVAYEIVGDQEAVDYKTKKKKKKKASNHNLLFTHKIQDFGARTVGFWHSEGGTPLERKFAPGKLGSVFFCEEYTHICCLPFHIVSESTSSNGAD